MDGPLSCKITCSPILKGGLGFKPHKRKKSEMKMDRPLDVLSCRTITALHTALIISNHIKTQRRTSQSRAEQSSEGTSMAALSSSSLFFSSKTAIPINNLTLIPTSLQRFSLPSSSSSFSSLSSSSSASLFTTHSLKSSRRSSPQGFTVKAEKKNVLIVNTNSGGHAVIGFYFAKELLSAGHAVTIMTVGEESSDKMKKTPFSRFSVSFFQILHTFEFSSFLNNLPYRKL